jgi:uncharacterized protein YidB (DUF937 family)
MSLLDQIVGLFTGGKPGAGQAAGAQPDLQAGLEQLVGLVLGPQSGGLQGLLAKFQQAGLGDLVNSWVGTGPSHPVTPEQVHEALGAEPVQTVAASTGISKEQVLALLSQHLPALVDHLTPNGQVPEHATTESPDLLTYGLTFLKSRLA